MTPPSARAGRGDICSSGGVPGGPTSAESESETVPSEPLTPSEVESLRSDLREKLDLARKWQAENPRSPAAPTTATEA